MASSAFTRATKGSKLVALAGRRFERYPRSVALTSAVQCHSRQQQLISPAPALLLQPASSFLQHYQQQHRAFATDNAAAPDKVSDPPKVEVSAAEEEYWGKKRAAKELRKQRYNEIKEHKEVVKRRRNGRPKKTRKKLFNQWFVPKWEQDRKHDRQARKLGLGWKYRVAVVVERIPIILDDRPKWESEWDNLNAYLGQFGHFNYPEEFDGVKEIHDVDYFTDEVVLAMHAPPGYDMNTPRETEADHNGDVRTLDRRLKTWVYLTVKETIEDAETGGENQVWNLPTVDVMGDETLLQTAKRAIKEKVGNSLKIWYPSNCPMTVDVHAFANEEERKQNDNTYGIKTFFMVVQYDDGKVTKDDVIVDDFAWYEKNELIEHIAKQEGEDKSKLYFYLLNDNWRHHFEGEEQS